LIRGGGKFTEVIYKIGAKEQNRIENNEGKKKDDTTPPLFAGSKTRVGEEMTASQLDLHIKKKYKGHLRKRRTRENALKGLLREVVNTRFMRSHYSSKIRSARTKR